MKVHLIFLFLVLGSCTSPTQRIAEHSMQIGLQQENTIVLDLANMAKQYAVDKAVAVARSAASDGDLIAVQGAVQDLASDFETISWLQIQHERARGVLNLARQYIWSRQGILDILLREFRQAQKIASDEELEEIFSGSS